MPMSFQKLDPNSSKSSTVISMPPNTAASSIQEFSLRLQAKSANFPRFFLQNTILPFILGSLLLTLISVLRDRFVQISCFSDQEVCRCSFFQMAFYAFVSIPLTELVPYSLIHVMLFSCKRSTIPVNFKRGISVFLIFVMTPITYIVCGVNFPHISARFANYAMALLFVYSAILCFTLFRGQSLRHFTREVACGTLCLLIPFFYYLLTDFLLPNFYFALTRIFEDKAKNLFQLMMVFINFVYEAIFFQILLRVSHYLLQQGNKTNTLLILLVRFYLATLYALRLGNIISLSIQDWGLYVQFLSLVVLVFETSTGRSFSKYFIVKPIEGMKMKIKSFLNSFYQIYLEMPSKNSMVAKKRMFFKGTHIPACKEDSTSLRINMGKSTNSERLNAHFAIPKIQVNSHHIRNQDLVKKAQKKLLEVISYQKFEFFLIYIPAMMSLVVTQNWRTPDPETAITESCGFNIINLVIHNESLFVYIFFDLALTFIFFKIFENYKNLRLKYEVGKVNLVAQILLYMGYQLIMETWIGRLAVLRLI